MEPDYAKKYFDLANAITGFAVIQMITLLVALGTSPVFVKNVASAPGWIFVLAGSVIATALYVGAVIACGSVEMRLLASTNREFIRLIKFTIAGRLGAIAAITGFGLTVLWQIVQRVGCAPL
jgi:hypothetical protein